MDKQEIEDLEAAAAAGRLFIGLGTGVSIALTNAKYPQLGWRGLIQSAFTHAEELGKISNAQNSRWQSQIASDDMDEMLVAAEFAGQKLGAPDGDLYARWLASSFSGLNIDNSLLQAALQTLHKVAPICTLNYDTLAEQALSCNPILLRDQRDTMDWMNSRSDSILHLHGHWRSPSSCVLGIRDYQKTLGDEVANTKSRKSVRAPSAQHHERVLAEYRNYILRECGQLTVEGIKADLETAQRKFDLEKLFVPLMLEPIPPEALAKKREQKDEIEFKEWLKNNPSPMTFAQAFMSSGRMVIMALPGGGKSTLLKRLAVAYSDSARRKDCDDELPDIDLFAVIIRCREWRDHIKQPIYTLFSQMASITGRRGLEGSSIAIEPIVKSGRLLLLVDGLDEIHNDAERAVFVEHLESFVAENQNIHLVVTSREAGFALVAPTLSRFCTRYRLAPLNQEAITLLCRYWHLIMMPSTQDAETEAYLVSKKLVGTTPLRRLAENPLLLTMLLVVKHGAGRLPPDRVSLYDGAIEVLLDTWNIRGHEPLNLKEAIPQLACIAFQMTMSGKVTATESELLEMMEEARTKVPQVQRYAQDTPHSFLKRVELRSSLLVEAGHQLERASVVPIFQFRHLTFQEYLTAVAVVQGYYLDYKQGDTTLDPLHDYLLHERWEEIVPMAAVLSQKQGEPIINALVVDGEARRQQMVGEITSNYDDIVQEGYNTDLDMPQSVSLLLQCLLEEIDVSPATLSQAIDLVAFFSKAGHNGGGLEVLARGPYGTELKDRTWEICKPLRYSFQYWARNTFAVLTLHSKTIEHWRSVDGASEIESLLASTNERSIASGILIISASFWTGNFLDENKVSRWIVRYVERYVSASNDLLRNLSTWTCGQVYNRQRRGPSSKIETFKRLVSDWLNDPRDIDRIGFTLGSIFNLAPKLPRINLTAKDRAKILSILRGEAPTPSYMHATPAAACIAFYSNMTEEPEVVELLRQTVRSHRGDRRDPEEWLIRLGKLGQVGAALARN